MTPTSTLSAKPSTWTNMTGRQTTGGPSTGIASRERLLMTSLAKVVGAVVDDDSALRGRVSDSQL